MGVCPVPEVVRMPPGPVEWERDPGEEPQACLVSVLTGGLLPLGSQMTRVPTQLIRLPSALFQRSLCCWELLPVSSLRFCC